MIKPAEPIPGVVAFLPKANFIIQVLMFIFILFFNQNHLRMKKLLLLFMNGLMVVGAAAQWAGNTNLTPATSGVKNNVATIPDGSGGMFMVWDDARNAATTGTDIYAQRVSNSGNLLWASAGVQACNTTGNQTGPVLCADGAGGMIIAWVDAAGDQDIYVQRINSSGAIQYGLGGIAFSANATNTENRPTLAQLNSTEAVIMFADNRNAATGVDVFANKITIATGAKVFATDLTIAAAANTQTAFSIAPDGSGGAYMAWQDPRISTTGSDIFVDRMNNNGTLQAGGNGVNITPLTSAAADQQLTPYCINDGAGNLLITWGDQRFGNTNGDIYVQKLTSSLAEQWTTKGVSVCNAAGIQSNPYIVTDGAGGLIATWSDARLAGDRNIYAQRVISTGVPQWAPIADGVPIVTATGNQPGSSTQSDIFITEDGSGGAVIAWGDVRNGAATGSGSNMDIYVQKINASGAVQWAADGLDIISPTGSGNQRQPVLVNGGSGNILSAWLDSRTAANGDIYGGKILTNGALPLQFVTISGSIIGNAINVSFTTTQEQNLAGLLVEKSVDGARFTAMATVKPANSISGSNYRMMDANPVKGTNYYRVKATDRDGTVHYSPVAAVQYQQKIAVEWALYPIPALNAVTLRITNATDGIYAFAITDIQGKTMMQKMVAVRGALFTQNMNIAPLAKGVYVARLTDASGTTVWATRLVKE